MLGRAFHVSCAIYKNSSMFACVLDKMIELIMNIGGGQELKDGYYVPCTIAGCGKRTKG